MHPQEEIWPPELGDGCISIAFIDLMWDCSLGILDCACPWDFLSKKWKAPLQLSVFHPIGKLFHGVHGLIMNLLVQSFAS